MNQSGSMVIMIVYVMAIVMVYITSSWRTVWYSMNVAYKRQLYEQHFRASDGLLKYGIALCKKNMTELLQSDAKEWNIPISPWPCGDKQEDYNGIIQVQKQQDNAIIIKAQLIHKNKLLFSLRCNLEQADNAYSINGWTIDTV